MGAESRNITSAAHAAGIATAKLPMLGVHYLEWSHMCCMLFGVGEGMGLNEKKNMLLFLVSSYKDREHIKH